MKPQKINLDGFDIHKPTLSQFLDIEIKSIDEDEPVKERRKTRTKEPVIPHQLGA